MERKPYYEMEKKVTLCMDNAYEVYNELKSRGNYLISDEMYIAVRRLRIAQNYLQQLAENEKEEEE